jgi:transposase
LRARSTLAGAAGGDRRIGRPAHHPHQRGRPQLIALPGGGVDTAGQLLVTAGHNPERLKSEAKFARLCGAAPIPVSSGRTDRHRLHRGGDRLANNAPWHTALVRMHCHQPTKDYVARRTSEGKTKTEILRRPERYIARETYP